MINQILAMSQSEMTKIIQPILDVCKVLVPVLLAVVGALGSVFVILLGVKYARAEEPQEHDKAKNALKNAIVGFVIIFVLLIMLQIGLSIFTEWWSTYNY